MSGKKKPTSWRCVSVQQQKDKAEIYNSRTWKELRIAKLRANPSCELCQAEGVEQSPHAIHHRIPIETARTKDEMRRLAFDWNNLVSVCQFHHAKLHKELGSNTRKVVLERARTRQERWMDSMLEKFTSKPDTNESPKDRE